MKKEELENFNRFRKKINTEILSTEHSGLKRFWALDSRAYVENVLNEKTLELLGLATSMVLRCDDCVTYHLIKCIQLGITDEELHDTLNVTLVVGGSITIPHIRRAFETIRECRKMQEKNPRLENLL
jgi:AhpD family alkylhydroperoxidase